MVESPYTEIRCETRSEVVLAHFCGSVSLVVTQREEGTVRQLRETGPGSPGNLQAGNCLPVRRSYHQVASASGKTYHIHNSMRGNVPHVEGYWQRCGVPRQPMVGQLCLNKVVKRCTWSLSEQDRQICVAVLHVLLRHIRRRSNSCGSNIFCGLTSAEMQHFRNKNPLHTMQ